MDSVFSGGWSKMFFKHLTGYCVLSIFQQNEEIRRLNSYPMPNRLFIHSFILSIYIAPLQDAYSGALPAQPRLKKKDYDEYADRTQSVGRRDDEGEDSYAKKMRSQALHTDDCFMWVHLIASLMRSCFCVFQMWLILIVVIVVII